jgi:copper oxidase (laccase) domain-containing protein
MKRIIQKQCHSQTINFVDFNTPLWVLGDGMITTEKDLGLIVYGSDCSIITFWDDYKIGACHAGWRGLVEGIIDEMVKNFQGGKCHIGPLLDSFEIQKDECFDKILSKYGDKYFKNFDNKIFFNFKDAVIDTIKSIPYSLDGRNTFEHQELSSWRRDKRRGDGTQNRLVIWRDSKDNMPRHRLFLHGESITEYFKSK